MKLIAHRGGGGLRVENTLAAFANAIKLGANGAELDVHLSRDGEVVVHHDAQLNPDYCRYADGDWIQPGEALPLAALTYSQMQAYDIGTPKPGTDYSRRFDRIQPVANQHIPLLREVIRLVKARSARFVLVIEIKASMFEAAGNPWAALVDATLAVITAERFVGRAVLCSFRWGSLRHAKRRQPQLTTWFTTTPLSWFREGPPAAGDILPALDDLRALRAGYAGGEAAWFDGFDPRRFGGSPARAVAAAGGDAWFPYHRDFTSEVAHELASLGLTGAAWSANLREPAEVARLQQAGLDALVMDYPDIAVPC